MSRETTQQVQLETEHEQLVREVSSLFESLMYRLTRFKLDPTPEAAFLVKDLAACVAEDMEEYMEWCDVNE